MLYHHRHRGRLYVLRSALTFLLAAMLSCAGPGTVPRTPLVFAAASLKDVLEDVGREFESRRGLSPVFNFAGSNVLALQIEATESGDILLSASEQWMDYVEEKGLLVPGTRRSFLSNGLVIIANHASTLELKNPVDLASAEFRFLSLANPEAVPAGRYAKQFLEDVAVDGERIWDRVRDRVAPAPDVRAALGMVEAQSDVLGIVYRTDAAVSDKVRVVLPAPQSLTPPISYAAAQVLGGRNREAGRAFLEFLASPEALDLFRKHGFVIPEGHPSL